MWPSGQHLRSWQILLRCAAAISAAASLILVAAGTYKPDESEKAFRPEACRQLCPDLQASHVNDLGDVQMVTRDKQLIQLLCEIKPECVERKGDTPAAPSSATFFFEGQLSNVCLLAAKILDGHDGKSQEPALAVEIIIDLPCAGSSSDQWAASS